METARLIQEVKLRPAIWNTGCTDYGDKHKVSSAWRQICKIKWPEFDTWSTDEKRTKCLQLQRKWLNVRQSFMKEQQAKGKEEQKLKSNQSYYDQLSFLLPVIEKTNQSNIDAGGGEKSEGPRPAKRTRTELSTDESVVSCGSQEIRDIEEDRLFLLSLVSFMQDVPRSSKLALRADMIKLISKYTPSTLDFNATNSPHY